MTGLVLAGGRSTRFGADKSVHTLHGVTLRDIAGRRLAEVCDAVLLSVRSPQSAEVTSPFTGSVADVFPGLGPLAGIHAGLLAMKSSRLLVMPCDMPFVSAETISRLAAPSNAPAVVATHDGFPIGVLACYDVSLLDMLEARLRKGGDALRVVEFVRSLPVWTPIEIGEVESSNVNTPTP